MKGSYYFVSASAWALGVPVMIVALFVKGPVMLPAIALAAFFLLVNTSPLNTALVNSVGSHIRATAIAVNIFLFHLFGDVPSPTLMGYVADRQSLQAAFILPVIAMAISSAILFYGMRFAPPLRLSEDSSAPPWERLPSRMTLSLHWQIVYWIRAYSRPPGFRASWRRLGMPNVAEISLDRNGIASRRPPRASPASASSFQRETKAEQSRETLTPCSRSITPTTKSSPLTIARPIARAKSWMRIARIVREAKARLKVIHMSELPSGWLGKPHAMWTAGQAGTGDWLLFTDADVLFKPDALRRAVAYAEAELAPTTWLFFHA